MMCSSVSVYMMKKQGLAWLFVGKSAEGWGTAKSIYYSPFLIASHHVDSANLLFKNMCFAAALRNFLLSASNLSVVSSSTEFSTTTGKSLSCDVNSVSSGLVRVTGMAPAYSASHTRCVSSPCPNGHSTKS
eukprot:PhM_4_TR13234/c0_g1_i1/m.79088